MKYRRPPRTARRPSAFLPDRPEFTLCERIADPMLMFLARRLALALVTLGS